MKRVSSYTKKQFEKDLRMGKIKPKVKNWFINMNFETHDIRIEFSLN